MEMGRKTLLSWGDRAKAKVFLKFLKELSPTCSAFGGKVWGASMLQGCPPTEKHSSLRKGFKKCRTLQEKKEWKRIIKSLAGEVL